MVRIGKFRTTVTAIVLGISFFAWVILLVNPGQLIGSNHCQLTWGYSDNNTNDPYEWTTMALCSTPNQAATVAHAETNVVQQLMGWGIMVIAMMLPKLIIPIRYICARSLKRKRFFFSVLFGLGYLVSWMLAGVLMFTMMAFLPAPAAGSYSPAIIVFVLAVIWQFSPIKQRFLNLGHDHWTLSAFGWRAIRDVLFFGVIHGVWCIGSGWALMLFPMLLPKGHELAMLIVTFVMISEHLEHPQVPRWTFDLRLRLWRIIVAKSGIHWKKIRV